MSAVADLATVARWCESGEEGRVEAWLEGEAKEKGEESKSVQGLLHAATRWDDD